MARPLNLSLTLAAVALGVNVSLSSKAFAQNAPFPFVIPWDDAAKTATDVSFLNPAPLEAKHRVVARDGHFFDQTGRRVRFLGVNLVYSSNFMDKADAEKVASRMHKFGINMVRLHHLDTLKAPNGIFPADSTNTLELDADQLDRLDYLVAQLKKNGIYVDLNLLVGRRFNAADGLQDAGNLPNFGRVISWFDPHTIQLQKDYAKKLLDRVNPYTKMRWADDPAVAIVEFNNEDTILGPNRAETLRNLPDFYKKQLVLGWNTFLKTKYASTDKMLASWNAGATPYGANRVNGRFETDLNGWQLESAPDTAQMSAENAEGIASERALKLQISGGQTNAAPVQLQFSNLSFQRGETMRLQFWAKAEAPRSVSVSVRQQKEPFKALGLERSVGLSTGWKKYAFAFKAPSDVKGEAKLAFTVPASVAGDIQLAEVALQSGNAIELDAGKTLEAANLEMPLYSATGQGADFAAYTMDIEARYVETMRAYVKETLGAKSLVTCSQSNWGGLGGLLRESKLDFVDMHAYWDHPDTFDAKSWKIRNVPMVRQNDGATLATLAMSRVAGKPYTISEYNHSAPNDFQAETLPFLAGFAAWQDWDGIFLFDYHSNRKTIAGANRIEKIFSIDSNPAKMALFPAAALLFLGGGMTPATTATLEVPTAKVAELMAQNNGALAAVWSKAGLSSQEMLRHQVGVRFSEKDGETKLQKGTAVDPKTVPFSWQADKKESADLRLNAPTSRFLVGFPSSQWQNGDFCVQTTSPDFATLALSSRDGQPVGESKSLLLTAISWVENKNMGWNEARTSVGDAWGEGPTQAWGVTATISVVTQAKRIQVHALDATGARLKAVPSQLQGGVLSFEIGPQYSTVWYEIDALV